MPVPDVKVNVVLNDVNTICQPGVLPGKFWRRYDQPITGPNPSFVGLESYPTRLEHSVGVALGMHLEQVIVNLIQQDCSVLLPSPNQRFQGVLFKLSLRYDVRIPGQIVVLGLEPVLTNNINSDLMPTLR